MANHLAMPTKETSSVPLKSLRNAIAVYIQNNYNDTHPDEFESDIKLWDKLREACISEGMHVSKIQTAIR